MKKWLVPLVIVLVSALIYTGCAQPAQSPTQAALTQAAPAQTSSTQTWNLKMHHHTSGAFLNQGIDVYAKNIEKATNGRVKVTVYPFGSLGNETAGWDLVTSDVADIAWTLTAFTPGKFPSTEIMSLPFLGVSSAEEGSVVLWDLVEKYPQVFDKEYSEAKMLTLHCGCPQLLCSVNKPIRTLDDFKGLNLRVPPGPATDMVKLMGANPLNVTVGDMYTSLQKGVIDAALIDWPGVDSFKLAEVTKYFTLTNLYEPVFWVAMNKNVWDSMPTDVQNEIMSVNGAAGAKFFGQTFDTIARATEDKVSKMSGKEIITPSADEVSKWQTMAVSLQNSYAQNLDAKGLPGKEMLDYVLQQIKSYSK